ncbi:unnamed protein product, partial [Mycena citricolor]
GGKNMTVSLPRDSLRRKIHLLRRRSSRRRRSWQPSIRPPSSLRISDWMRSSASDTRFRHSSSDFCACPD